MINAISLIQLPNDILTNFISRLEPKFLLSTRTFCKRWFDLISNAEDYWESISKLQMPNFSKLDQYTWKQHYMFSRWGAVKKIVAFAHGKGTYGVLGYKGAFCGNLYFFEQQVHTAYDAHPIKNYFAAGTLDGTIVINSFLYEKCFHSFKAYQSFIIALKWLNNNLLAATTDCKLDYWVRSKGKYKIHRSIKMPRQQRITCLETIKANKTFYVLGGTADGRINLMTLARKNKKHHFKFVHTVKVYPSAISALCVAFQKNQEIYLFAGAAQSRNIEIIKIENNTLIHFHTIKNAHRNGIREFKYISNDEIISLGKDDRVKRWTDPVNLSSPIFGKAFFSSQQPPWVCFNTEKLKATPWSVCLNRCRLTYIGGDLGDRIIKQTL